jgi:hypothetical protein
VSLEIVIVDIVGLVMAVAGFTMAFRQKFVRRLLGRPEGRAPQGSEGDPLTYALRIGGVMVMVFGIVIAGMMTLFHLEQG